MSDSILSLVTGAPVTIYANGKKFTPDKDGNYRIPQADLETVQRVVAVQESKTLRSADLAADAPVGSVAFDIDAQAERIVTTVGRGILAEDPNLAAAGFPWERAAVERIWTTAQIKKLGAPHTEEFVIPETLEIQIPGVVCNGIVHNVTDNVDMVRRSVAEFDDEPSDGSYSFDKDNINPGTGVYRFNPAQEGDTVSIAYSTIGHGYNGMLVIWVEGDQGYPYIPITFVGGRWAGPVGGGGWDIFASLDAVTMVEAIPEEPEE